MSKTLDVEYSKLMAHHPFGIALYRPLSSDSFKPGACGYFDEFGHWNPICDLEDSISLETKGLNLLEDPIERAPSDQGITWAAKLSVNMRGIKVPLKAGIDPALGIPVTVSSVYEYSSDKNEGAVLLTAPPITNDRLYHKMPLKNWVKKNATKIIKCWPEVKEHKLWVVTSTYSTKKCALNMWKGKRVSCKVGFSIDAPGGAVASVGGEWYQSQKDEGWAEYSMEGNNRCVVFFCGLAFDYIRKLNGTKELKPRRTLPPLRGGGEIEEKLIFTIPDPDSDGGIYEIECEEFIDDEDDESVEDSW